MPSFFPARLMSPEEVAGAIGHQPEEVRKHLGGRWYLCGDVSEEMYCLLKASLRSDTAMRVSGFTSPLGLRYAVVTHQLMGHAHRFLLPLYEAKVGDFLLAMRGGSLGFSLGCEGGENAALLVPPPGGTDAFLPLLPMAEPLSGDMVPQVITELPLVIAALNNPEQVPSCRVGEQVVDVTVSALLPSQTLRRFWGLEAAA